ncbi:MAG: ribose-5-phosphate isomerase RpiA [Methyloprofundus sp.]|nr:ribose-5-phosphate isomerase RpiA [Methyloprofundus sp.]MDT8427006.1 ribose-5-phosphate isomerase RpiA [Methyloprofundus sp.]
MNDKQAVAEYALNYVQNGMIIGLGTGSTANCFIEALAQRYKQENLQIKTVASSLASQLKAQQLGLPIIAIEHIKKLDIYIDGADEVASDMTLLKGRGSDLVKEKLLVEAAEQFIVLIEPSKQVNRIGDNFPIPVEVLPFAWQLVQQKMHRAGAQVTLRKTDSGLAITSCGNLVLDLIFDSKLSTARLNALLNATSGIVEHGIFQDLADIILLANKGEITKIMSAK